VADRAQAPVDICRPYAIAGPIRRATVPLRPPRRPSLVSLSPFSSPSPYVLVEAEEPRSIVAASSVSQCATIVELLLDLSSPAHHNTLLYHLHPLAESSELW
jgi:hypothetical protein